MNYINVIRLVASRAAIRVCPKATTISPAQPRQNPPRSVGVFAIHRRTIVATVLQRDISEALRRLREARETNNTKAVRIYEQRVDQLTRQTRRTHQMKRDTTRRDRHRKLIARDKPACHWCNEDIDYQANHLDPLAFQIDHVIPLAKGGLDIIENIVAAHRKCNRDKSDTIIHPAGISYITERNW